MRSLVSLLLVLLAAWACGAPIDEPRQAVVAPGTRPRADETDENAVLRTTQTFEWFHSLGEIVTSLSAVGLRIEFLHEHKVLAWRGVRGLVKQDEHFYGLPDSWPEIPLSFSLRAVKEG